MRQDSVTARLIINDMIKQVNNGDREEKVIRKAKVAPNGRFFLIYEESFGPRFEDMESKIVIYNAERKELWRKEASNTRRVSFELSDVYDSLFVIAVSDFNGGNPVLHLIKDGMEYKIVKNADWMRMLSYRISSNCRFLVLHVRKRYFRKPWDYIYFIDFGTETEWEYVFPTCLSCKRARISLDVDNTGQVEVIHRAEHRVFSKDGKMIDYFVKLD